MLIEIDCKAIAEAIEAEAHEMAAKFEAKTGRNPWLATIIANNDPASERYVRNKMRACERCGIGYHEIIYTKNELIYIKNGERTFMESFDNDPWSRKVGYEFMHDDILNTIADCNGNYRINGLMLQLPTYDGLNANELIQFIDPAKDVDCLTVQNMGKLALGDNSFMPATVAGIMRLFKEEGYDLQSKVVVIRGRSNIVGKPLALAMINAGATVISENSHSFKSVEEILGRGVYTNEGSCYESTLIDVIVDATGVEDFDRRGVICDYYIDVTTIVGEDGKLHGSFGTLNHASKLTPVPRGVGLLTCAQLAWNTAYLACEQVGIDI